MLVLGRRTGERIFIGEDIIITLLEVDRGKVKLGIDAPRDIPVHREEVVRGWKATPVPKVAEGQ